MSKFRNNMKKAAAMTMAVAMSLMGVVGVNAENGKDIIDTAKATSLTIYKYDQTAAEKAGVDLTQFTSDGEADAAAEAALADYALKGVEFTYLRVGSINTDSQDGALQLLYDIPDELEVDLGLNNANNKYTSDELNTAMKNALADNTNTKNTLENYVQSKGGTRMSITNDAGKTSASGLAQGLYLVVETKVPEEVHTTTDPFFVSLPMTDATGDYWNYDVVVYPKNQTNNPTVDKVVKQASEGVYYDVATVSEGDELDYRIVTKIPTITSQATYLTKLDYKDTLSKGIAYNKDTTIEFYDNEDAAKQGGTPTVTWAAGSPNFSVKYDDTQNTMAVSITAEGLKAINPAQTDKYMTIIYKATVKSDASVKLGDAGNGNDVTVTYSRTNTIEENTIKDKTTVYTFGINLTKKFSDGKGDATKVNFVLQNRTNNYYVTATGADGVYYVTDATQGAAEKDGTVFVPAADGKLIINGLEADTYVLTELHTADGYSLLKEPMVIDITSTEDEIIASKATQTGIDNPNADVIVTNLTKASATVDNKDTAMSGDNGSDNARVDMSVLNTNSFTLPQTGGLGTLVYTLAGAAVLCAGVVLVTRKKKQA